MQLGTTSFSYITSFCRNIHNFVWKFKDATKISSVSEMSSMYVFFGRYDGMINSAGTVEFEIHKVTRGAIQYFPMTSPNVNNHTIYDC